MSKEAAKKNAREELYDLQSEESLISHACNQPKLLAEHYSAVYTLTGERKELAEAVYKVASAGDPLTEESLRLAGYSEEIRKLFTKLAPLTPPSNPERVIARLRDVAARREVATASAKAYGLASDGKDAAEKALEELESATTRARSILHGDKTSGGICHVGELDDMLNEIAWRAQNPTKIKGITFGFPQLEKMLDGLQGSKYYLLGARPSVGKTALAGQIAVNLADMEIPSVFFSCEMSKTQVQQRLLATKCGVNPSKSVDSPLMKHELIKLRDGVIAMKKWPLWIDDTDRISIDRIRSESRRLVSQHGVKCIIIDYIQLVRGVEPKSRNSKRDEVGEVSGALKALCKELDVPVVALAQLRRSGNAYSSASGSTQVPKPTLESLKESGDLEQDADSVIMLHRDVQQNASEATAIIAKNRSGGCGEVDLSFANDTTSFSEQPYPRPHP